MVERVSRTRELGLCISCEICNAACPRDAIDMEYSAGQFLPVIDDGKCVDCGLCMELCPGIDLDPERLHEKPKQQLENVDAQCLGSYTVMSRDLELLKNSTSGGFVTGLTLELLRRGDYKEAFVLDYDFFNGQTARLDAFGEQEEIRNAAKSKYIPASAYNVIRALEDEGVEKYILVGTPCLVHGIRKFMKIKGISSERILVIGLFCDLAMNYNFYSYFQDNYCTGGRHLEKLEFRTKEKTGWPGGVKIIDDAGGAMFPDRRARMEVKEYFRLPRCVLCCDKLNRQADISVGDCYITGKDSYYGRSSIITRTSLGERVFQDCRSIFRVEDEAVKVIGESQNNDKRLVEHTRNLDYFLRSRGIEGDRLKLRERFGKESRSFEKALRLTSVGVAYSKGSIKRSILLRKMRQKLIGYSGALRKYGKVGLKTAWGYLVKPFGRLPDKDQRNGVLILGGSFHNKGAQAMAFTAVDMVRKKDPGARIYFSSEYDFKKPEEEKAIYNFRIVNWSLFDFLKKSDPKSVNTAVDTNEFPGKNSEPEKEIMKNLNLVIDISGFNLSSERRTSNVMRTILQVILARMNGIPVIMMPQSLGPFNYPVRERLVLFPLLWFSMRYPYCIFAREKAGLEHLRKFTRDNIEFSYDMVLAHRDYDLDNIFLRGVEIKEIDIHSGSVCIIPSSRIFDRDDINKLVDIYGKIINVLRENDKTVYLFRHSYEDLDACLVIKSAFPNDDSVILINEELNAFEIDRLMGKFEFVIASRYHSVVHCYRNRVPAVVIGWAVKYHELLELFEQLDYYFDIRDGLELEAVLAAVLQLVERYKSESEKIVSKAGDILEAGEYQQSAIGKFLDGSYSKT